MLQIKGAYETNSVVRTIITGSREEMDCLTESDLFKNLEKGICMPEQSVRKNAKENAEAVIRNRRMVDEVIKSLCGRIIEGQIRDKFVEGFARGLILMLEARRKM